MRYEVGRKEKTRELIVKEAARAVRIDGPRQVGVAAVMAKAGLTHGGFYAHFDSKDAMVDAAIARMFDDTLARWRRTVRDKSPAQGLVDYIDIYLSAHHRDARSTGCPIASIAADLPRLSDECRQSFAAGLRRLCAVMSEKLGELGFSDPDPLASSVLAELSGALTMARCEPDRTHSDATLAASRRLIKARLGLEAQQ